MALVGINGGGGITIILFKKLKSSYFSIDINSIDINFCKFNSYMYIPNTDIEIYINW